VPVETRLQLVPAVLAHEMTVAEAARRHGVSGTTVSTSGCKPMPRVMGMWPTALARRILSVHVGPSWSHDGVSG
jgi:hypothetical protein